jgi:hypothetical protein
MTHSEVLCGGTLALVDTNPDVLETMMALANRVVEATGAPTSVIGSTDRTEVLKDADFVVFTFSDRNAHFRGLDCEVSEKYGVRMCSGDTIGPGGIFRALREIPHALDITLCPLCGGTMRVKLPVFIASTYGSDTAPVKWREIAESRGTTRGQERVRTRSWRLLSVG